ncbi:MAG TPA: DinB family protein [Longimicrobium sp.]|jgi:uncharacterized damage-inducible protein DinB|nr:DinB family protein [Longimicrobium sp.]
MDAETLRHMFGLATRALAANLEGFTEADALAQPPGGGNCVNWVVGHVIVHRNHMLRALGHEPVWGADADARYDRASPPVTGAEGALPLAALTEALDRSRERVLAALEAATDEQLGAAPVSESGNATGPVGRRVALLMVHEGYHAGQVATLRRISGRAGAIR